MFCAIDEKLRLQFRSCIQIQTVATPSPVHVVVVVILSLVLPRWPLTLPRLPSIAQPQLKGCLPIIVNFSKPSAVSLIPTVQHSPIQSSAMDETSVACGGGSQMMGDIILENVTRRQFDDQQIIDRWSLAEVFLSVRISSFSFLGVVKLSPLQTHSSESCICPPHHGKLSRPVLGIASTLPMLRPQSGY